MLIGLGGLTYWFIKLVLPTPLSPRMMTYEGRISQTIESRRSRLEETYLEVDLPTRSHLAGYLALGCFVAFKSLVAGSGARRSVPERSKVGRDNRRGEFRGCFGTELHWEPAQHHQIREIVANYECLETVAIGRFDPYDYRSWRKRAGGWAVALRGGCVVE